MIDFYKRAIDLLLKQAPLVIFAVLTSYMLWQKTERMDALRIQDRIEVRKECAETIIGVRDELSGCQKKYDGLHQKYEGLADNYQKVLVELSALKAVVTRWGKRGGNDGYTN